MEVEQSVSLEPHFVRAAWIQALPVVFGYLPIGFAFGILAIKAGISIWNTIAMSVFVFAGSAQLIAVGLFAAGQPSSSIIITTFIVNLRHLLMSAALAPYLHRWKRAWIALFAYELTDETFAVHSVRFSEGKTGPRVTLLINIIAQVAWVTGTILGILGGDLIRDVKPFGLDYALIAMFAALLVFQIRNGRLLVVALISGLLSTALVLAGVNQWNVILATLVGATLGVLIEIWTKATSS